MKAFLLSLLKDLVLEGLPKLWRAITRNKKRKEKQEAIDAALEKYEQTGDPKDLAAYEDLLNS
jgi:hypothetical protein